MIDVQDSRHIIQNLEDKTNPFVRTAICAVRVNSQKTVHYTKNVPVTNCYDTLIGKTL